MKLEEGGGEYKASGGTRPAPSHYADQQQQHYAMAEAGAEGRVGRVLVVVLAVGVHLAALGPQLEEALAALDAVRRTRGAADGSRRRDAL